MRAREHCRSAKQLPEGWVLDVEAVKAQLEFRHLKITKVQQAWGALREGGKPLSSAYTSKILDGISACSEERLLALAAALDIAPRFLIRVPKQVAA
jgi:hypothetical protein